MNKTILISFLFLINTICLADDTSDRVNLIKKSMLLIHADGETCPGVFISEDRILTAASCVPFLFNTSISMATSPENRIEATVVKKSKELDLAILKINSPLVDKPEYLKVRPTNEEVKSSERFFAINEIPGRNTDDNFSLSNLIGTFGSVTFIFDDNLTYSFSSDFGPKGCPILDSQNRLVGIIPGPKYLVKDEFISVPGPNKIKEFISDSEKLEEPVSIFTAKNTFDIEFWLSEHSNPKKYNKPSFIGNYGPSFNYLNRFRLTFLIGPTAMEEVFYSSWSLGYKFPILTNNGKNLYFFIVSLDDNFYDYTPGEEDKAKQVHVSGSGLSFTINTGNKGIALKYSILSINNEQEQIIGTSYFF